MGKISGARRRSGRWAAVVAAVVSVAGVWTAAARAADPPLPMPTTSTGSTATTASAVRLDVGGVAFWDGPLVALAGFGSDDGSGNATTNPGVGTVNVERCSNPAVGAVTGREGCFDYDLDVAAGGRELRIAVDHPSNFDSFGILLTDPAGDVVASDTGEALTALPGQVLYAAELTVTAPAPGRWRATVVANDVRASAFRVRAALLGPRAGTTPGRVALLPNLRVVPPFQVGFGPCQDAEKQTYGAVRCLRLSEGPSNIGDGPLELIVDTVGEPGEDANGQASLVGTQRQVVHYSDGSTEVIDAGRFEYHLAHTHYHHSQTGNFELLRVTNRGSGSLVHAGDGPKQGFCMGDYLIAEWTRIASAPRRTDLDYFGRPNCGVPTPGRTQMQLSAGWGDVYPRFIEGQYVEFGTNPDGLYVLRAAVNPDGSILESRSEDNVGYTYLRVCGDDVDVIERGIGTDPWDKAKIVIDDGRQVTMDSPKTSPSPALADDRPCPKADD